MLTRQRRWLRWVLLDSAPGPSCWEHLWSYNQCICPVSGAHHTCMWRTGPCGSKKHEKTVEGRAPEDILRMPTATRVCSHICPVRDCSAWLSPPLTKVQQGRMQAYCLLEVNPCTMLTQMTSNPCICNTYFTLYQNILYQKFCCKKMHLPIPSLFFKRCRYSFSWPFSLRFQLASTSKHCLLS